MEEKAQVALANDVTEAGELQEALKRAGIECEIKPGDEVDGFSLLVQAEEIEAAQEVLELADPDDLVTDD